MVGLAAESDVETDHFIRIPGFVAMPVIVAIPSVAPQMDGLVVVTEKFPGAGFT